MICCRGSRPKQSLDGQYHFLLHIVGEQFDHLGIADKCSWHLILSNFIQPSLEVSRECEQLGSFFGNSLAPQVVDRIEALLIVLILVLHHLDVCVWRLVDRSRQIGLADDQSTAGGNRGLSSGCVCCQRDTRADEEWTEEAAQMTDAGGIASIWMRRNCRIRHETSSDPARFASINDQKT